MHLKKSTVTMKRRSRSKVPRRILVAKLGLDGHDRGIKIIARALRDAGFEVIYTGLFQTPKHIALAAVQEDVRMVAISILSGAHMVLFPKVIRFLKQLGAGHIRVVGGGIISTQEAQQLEKKGLHIFGPGTRVKKIVAYINQELS